MIDLRHLPVVRNESLYLTLAQVLPTLLIVVVLEIRTTVLSARTAAFQARAPIAPQLDANAPDVDVRDPAYLWWEYQRQRYWLRLVTYLSVAGIFAIGEGACVAAPIFGLAGWHAWVFGPAALLAVVVMSGYVLMLPFAAVVSLDIADDLADEGGEAGD